MEVAVRLEVHYCTPLDTVLGDVLRLLRSQTWAAFMTRHIGPRLEKVSPVDTSMLERFDKKWQVEAGYCLSEGCVICMDSGDEYADDSTGMRRSKNSSVQLPCGHGFHHRCIHSWLQLQSTCPICRWQFPKEFAGRFVVRRLQSTAVLPQHIRSWPRANIAYAPVGGHYVRVMVSLTLEKTIIGDPFGVSYPCEMTVLLLDEASGEIFSEMDTRISTVPCHFAAPQHRIASTRFASLEETKFTDELVSSSVARETGRKRRCFRSPSKTNKRQRVSSE
ncbi:hypothetical protein L915_05269 [Phytophthora nicotianae]|uniref:RING-type domain-containing protein n=1 Tax=Phytophthora nicotianae TaxID=4792 RepID=W2H8Y8_PHYNI|nr:hypothetical protein L915_05269 [Phytophthora nicotianae]ETL44501.1 hypothetical protein L916_05223 [Phytophthora nicotianae]